MNSSTSRIVVLVDMDCFYCQVEEKLEPSLEGKPIAVVQYNAWKGGGIIAVNYPARDLGVTRHMRGNEAKEKCPEIQLVSVPSVRGKADLTKYREAGKMVAEVLQTFTPLLQRASVDEAYLDITDAVNNKLKLATQKLSKKDLQNTHVVGCDINDFIFNIYNNDLHNETDLKLAIGGAIVQEIRAAVYEKTGYRCSAGIAHNKILAKLACGLHKPNQQTILPQDSVSGLYENLPVRKIKNLGGKFGSSLSEKLNVTYMGELKRFTEKELLKKFDDKTALWLYNIARGIDTEPVTVRLVSKSIGCCKKFPGKTALKSPHDVLHWLNELAEEIVERLTQDLEENNRRAKQMTVSFAQEINRNDVHSSRTHVLKAYDVKRVVNDAFEVLKKSAQKSDGTFHLTYLGISVGKFENCKHLNYISTFFKAAPKNTVSDLNVKSSNTDKCIEGLTQVNDVTPDFEDADDGSSTSGHFEDYEDPSILNTPNYSRDSQNVSKLKERTTRSTNKCLSRVRGAQKRYNLRRLSDLNLKNVDQFEDVETVTDTFISNSFKEVLNSSSLQEHPDLNVRSINECSSRIEEPLKGYNLRVRSDLSVNGVDQFEDIPNANGSLVGKDNKKHIDKYFIRIRDKSKNLNSTSRVLKTVEEVNMMEQNSSGLQRDIHLNEQDEDECRNEKSKNYQTSSSMSEQTTDLNMSNLDEYSESTIELDYSELLKTKQEFPNCDEKSIPDICTSDSKEKPISPTDSKYKSTSPTDSTDKSTSPTDSKDKAISPLESKFGDTSKSFFIRFVQNKSPTKNRLSNEDSSHTKLCPECNQKLLETEYVTHMDHHVALKLMAEEKQLFQEELQAKKLKSPVKNTKSVKRKLTKLDKTSNITMFLVKKTNKENDENVKQCSECNKQIALQEFQCHLDFHAAKKLHLELNPMKVTQSVQKRSKNDVKGAQSISYFFKPVQN